MSGAINRTKAMLGMSPNKSGPERRRERGSGKLKDLGPATADDLTVQLRRRRLGALAAGQTGKQRFATILGEYVRQQLGESGG